MKKYLLFGLLLLCIYSVNAVVPVNTSFQPMISVDKSVLHFNSNSIDYLFVKYFYNGNLSIPYSAKAYLIVGVDKFDLPMEYISKGYYKVIVDISSYNSNSGSMLLVFDDTVKSISWDVSEIPITDTAKDTVANTVDKVSSWSPDAKIGVGLSVIVVILFVVFSISSKK